MFPADARLVEVVPGTVALSGVLGGGNLDPDSVARLAALPGAAAVFPRVSLRVPVAAPGPPQSHLTLPPTANIPTPRAGAGATVLNGRLIVLGGESPQPLAHANVEALDPATGRWTALRPLATGRHATQAVLHGVEVFEAIVRSAATHRPVTVVRA